VARVNDSPTSILGLAISAQADLLVITRTTRGAAVHHTHDWAPTPDGYTCTSCTDITTACSECHQPLETTLTICDRCLTRARQIVQDTIDAIDTVPYHHAEIMGLRGIRYDRDLVTTSNDPDRLPFGLDNVIEDPEDTRIAAAKHPDTAISVLHSWADAWADTRGDTAPTNRLRYLLDHTLWAAQNPNASGWDAYITEARQVRTTIRRLLGITPQREPTPCVHCAGPITREWGDNGLDDTRTCTRCHATWPDADHLDTTNQHAIRALPHTHPDKLVTADDARQILPDLKRNTLNQALKRDRDRVTEDPTAEPRIPIRGTDPHARLLYRLGAIATLTITAVAA